MDSYTLAKDSPTTRVTVNKKKLRLNGEPQNLTKDEVASVEATGAKLEKVEKSSGSSGNS